MEESSNLIPQLEAEIPKLQEQLNQEEKVLERIKESSRGDASVRCPCSLNCSVFCLITKLSPSILTDETERLRAELTQVRTELEPWENQIIEHKGRLDVASAEKELMKQKVGLSVHDTPFFSHHNLLSNGNEFYCRVHQL